VNARHAENHRFKSCIAQSCSSIGYETSALLRPARNRPRVSGECLPRDSSQCGGLAADGPLTRCWPADAPLPGRCTRPRRRAARCVRKCGRSKTPTAARPSTCVPPARGVVEGLVHCVAACYPVNRAAPALFRACLCSDPQIPAAGESAGVHGSFAEGRRGVVRISGARGPGSDIPLSRRTGDNSVARAQTRAGGGTRFPATIRILALGQNMASGRP
jgi:hypothetical protein